jgi:hypothetical protein
LQSGPSTKSAKPKKKAAVPLSQFNEMLNVNGIGSSTGAPLIAEDDDALMHQFRLETQLELEREKLQQAQRVLLESRNTVI